MIRVEPGSTPGIGITIFEHFFFGLFRLLLWDVCCFLQEELVVCSSGAGKNFDTYCYYMYLQILGFGGYILLHQLRQCR